MGAKQASLTIMVGGPDAAFARAKPLFDLMGKNITHVGSENGAGQTCKVANQIIVALNIQAVAEALVFASKAGADPAKVRQALMGGFASSRILEVHAERMLNGTFNPGFRIRLHQKDLNLALGAAKDLQLSLPNTAIAQQMFASCMAHGGGELDHSAMILAIEGMAKHAIRGGVEPASGVVSLARSRSAKQQTFVGLIAGCFDWIAAACAPAYRRCRHVRRVLRPRSLPGVKRSSGTSVADDDVWSCCLKRVAWHE